MKNTKIYPKDWLQLHPYKQSGPTDLYYTRIANQIHEIMEHTDLVNSFEKEDAIQVSMRMAAYFEDVISGLNIWRAFITQYKELTGNYVPFYTVSDHYYDDEANFEDVRFLLWHYLQQYHGVKRVPLSTRITLPPKRRHASSTNCFARNGLPLPKIPRCRCSSLRTHPTKHRNNTFRYCTGSITTVTCPSTQSLI